MRLEAWASTIAVIGAAAFGAGPARAADPAEATADDADRKPPRPPLPPPPPRAPLPWEEHLEVGAGVAFAFLPATTDGLGKPTNVRLLPSLGVHAHVGWRVLRYLSFTAYLVDARHPLVLPPGSLGQSGRVESDAVHTYAFGARV